MKRRSYRRPSIENALFLHQIVEKHGAEKGYLRNLLEACLDYPFITTHGYTPHKDIFTKAAALLYAVITFHPFVDGNKRTALLLTSLFLALNGYQFEYPSDTVEKTIAIAKGELEIPMIATWLKSKCKRRKIELLPLEIERGELRPQINLKQLFRRRRNKNKV